MRGYEGATGNCAREVAGNCSGEGNREWLVDFTENLEIAEVLAAAEIYPEHHIPLDRNCEVCLRTKMTRALCRRRTGEAVPRAKKFGDLITADHKNPQRGK